VSQSLGTAVITIPPDDDGMVGCQCPQESCRPRYFKISSLSSAAQASSDGSAEAQVSPEIEGGAPSVHVEEEDARGANVLDQDELAVEQKDEAVTEVYATTNSDILHCPYCGHAADRQKFFTPEQREYAESLVLREITGMFHQQLKQLEKRPDPHAFLSIGISVRTGALPQIATYEENRLKQHVVCPHCKANYAVYGVSFTCPRCGGGTLLWHLESTAHEIRVFLELPDDILVRLDARSQEKLIENAVEDVVSFWEGYLKALYRKAIRDRYEPEKASQLERQIGTVFQRLPGSTERFAKDLGIDLLTNVAPDDTELLTRVFNKRHVLTHNLGLVDEKFLTQTHLDQQVGQEIEVTREETVRALEIVSQVLKRTDEQVRSAQ
jgi:hypothetical protein